MDIQPCFLKVCILLALLKLFVHGVHLHAQKGRGKGVELKKFDCLLF